jgi:hypothetical protein
MQLSERRGSLCRDRASDAHERAHLKRTADEEHSVDDARDGTVRKGRRKAHAAHDRRGSRGRQWLLEWRSGQERFA